MQSASSRIPVTGRTIRKEETTVNNDPEDDAEVGSDTGEQNDNKHVDLS